MSHVNFKKLQCSRVKSKGQVAMSTSVELLGQNCRLTFEIHNTRNAPNAFVLYRWGKHNIALSSDHYIMLCRLE